MMTSCERNAGKHVASIRWRRNRMFIISVDCSQYFGYVPGNQGIELQVDYPEG